MGEGLVGEVMVGWVLFVWRKQKCVVEVEGVEGVVGWRGWRELHSKVEGPWLWRRKEAAWRVGLRILLYLVAWGVVDGGGCRWQCHAEGITYETLELDKPGRCPC